MSSKKSELKVKLLTNKKKFNVPIVVTGRCTDPHTIRISYNMAVKIFTTDIINELKSYRVYSGDTNSLKQFIDTRHVSYETKLIINAMIADNLRLMLESKSGELIRIRVLPFDDLDTTKIRINLDLTKELGLTLDSDYIEGYSYRENFAIKKFIAKM